MPNAQQLDDLVASHENLVALVKELLTDEGNDKRPKAVTELLRLVQRFVRDLSASQGGNNLLEQHARFVECECARGSTYQNSLIAAANHFTSLHSPSVGEAAQCAKLKTMLSPPAIQTEAELKQLVNRFHLGSLVMELREDARIALQPWQSECERILEVAANSKTAGTRVLTRLSKSLQTTASEDDRDFAASFLSKPNTDLLQSIVSAADYWLAQVQPTSQVANAQTVGRRKGKKRRKKDDVNTPTEMQIKIGKYLIDHHQYESASNSILNPTPAENNDIARSIGCSRSTVSVFWGKTFGSHKRYENECCRAGQVHVKTLLKRLVDPLSPLETI